MSRSGSTLLDKLLANHPDISSLSQPFPLLYVEIKKAFFKSINHPESIYYLNNLFLEGEYGPEQLVDFLDNYSFSKKQLFSIFDDMKDYSGQYTKCTDIDSIIDQIDEFNLVDVVRQLLYLLRHNDKARTYGSKEVIIEEFLPFFIGNGFRGIVIVRDPRDVINSTFYGNKEEYVGGARPVLFHLRNWRKSVSFCAGLTDNPNFLQVRYEDLVKDTDGTLREITNFLKVSEFEHSFIDRPILDQKGRNWKSNSSFKSNKGVTNASLKKYRQNLSDDEIKYIEYTCYPEMKFLGYDFENEKVEFEDVKNYKEHFNIERSEFTQDYSYSEENLTIERKRIELLSQEISDEEKRKWFIFSKAYNIYKHQ